MRMRALALSAVIGLLAASVLTALVDARPVAHSTIALLANGDYVDLGTVDSGGEVENLVPDLEDAGHTVNKFDDVSASGLTAALDGADVLVIPELENDDQAGGDSVSAAGLGNDLTTDAQDVIRSFVDGGGRILFFGSSDPTYLINQLFGFSTSTQLAFCGPTLAKVGAAEASVAPTAVGDPCPLTSAAAATEFADGPSSVTYVNDSTGLDPASLPDGTTTAYDGQGYDEGAGPLAVEGAAIPAEPPVVDLAAVVSMPYGDGAVVYLGWDWFPETEAGAGSVGSASVAEEADWAIVLDLAVSQPTVTAATTPGKVTFTSDSPSTQPVFVSTVVDGVTTIVTIPAKTTTGILDLADGGSVAWSVPGWGVGEGAVEVEATNITAPVPAPLAPSYTG